MRGERRVRATADAAALRARSDAFTVSDESLELAWVPVTEIAAMDVDASVRRMAEKWLERGATAD